MAKTANKPKKATKPKGKPVQKPAKPLKPRDNEPKFPKKPLPGKQVVQAFAGNRPLDADELDLVTFVVGRLDQARAFVAERFGSADPTPEYLAARRKYDEHLGSEESYLYVTSDDPAALAPWAVQSYAEFAANACSQPRSSERSVWSMLRAAEIDVVRLAESLNVAPDGTAAMAPTLLLGSRRFTCEYLDRAMNDYEARLTVEDVSHTLN